MSMSPFLVVMAMDVTNGCEVTTTGTIKELI